MKNTLFGLLLLLATPFIHAQSNFQSGYILTTANDTVYGLIDNKDYYKNSLFCDFKKSDNEPIVRYYPSSIYGYRFTNGKFYVSKTTEIDKRTVTLFMEYLIHGRLDIFFYQDKLLSNHYFAAKDTIQPVELKYSKEVVNDDGKLMLKETKKYIGLLTYLTSDCSVLKDKISEIKAPDHKSLIDFAEKYHNMTCSNEKCIIYQKRLPNKIAFKAYAGATYLLSNTVTDTIGKWQPVFGFDLLFQQTQQSESIFLGIGLRKAKLTDGFLMKGYQIPVSINYYKQRQGLSPAFSYEFDLNYGFIVEALWAGINCRIDNASFLLGVDVKTFKLINVFGGSITFGINLDLN